MKTQTTQPAYVGSRRGLFCSFVVFAIAAVMCSTLLFAVRASAKTSVTTLRPNHYASMVMSRPSQRNGEWVLKIRVSSDGDKKFTIRARRGSAPSFNVIDSATARGRAFCEGAAGSIYCTKIVAAGTSPGNWTFTTKNTGTYTFKVTITATWRVVSDAR